MLRNCLILSYKLYDYQTQLVNDARKELLKGNKSVLLVSPAGSGKSVVIAEIARLTTVKGGHVLFMVHRKELIDQIKESFIENDVDLNSCTIMTVGRIKNRLDILPKPSLIITDETHHSLAKTYRDIYDFYSDVPRLGFTATPWRLNGKGFKEIYDSMVLGKQVQWLIDNNRLADYKLIAPPFVNSKMLKKGSNGDYTTKSIDEALDSGIFGDTIKTWNEYAKDQQTIVYCHSVEFSKRVADLFNSNGISAAHADSNTPEKTRDGIMQRFKTGEIKVLCNVDLISEGFNVPDCSCVIMLRPTASLVLYIQQSMRCMRFKPGKQAIIIDQVNNWKKHGLPSQDRHWSLEDRFKGNKKNNETSRNLAIKQCPKCFQILKANIEKCTNPNCGYSFEKKRKLKHIDSELVEVDKNDFHIKANYLLNKHPSELNTLEELKQFAKLRNYKNGWIYYQQKERGWI